MQRNQDGRQQATFWLHCEGIDRFHPPYAKIYSEAAIFRGLSGLLAIDRRRTFAGFRKGD